MIKLTIEQILASIEALSAEDKEVLRSQLFGLLPNSEEASRPDPSMVQHKSFSVGRDFHIQGEGITADFSQVQTKGGTSQNRPSSPEISEQDFQALATAINDLRLAIAANTDLNQLEKQISAVPLDTLEEELQKPEPNKSLIDQAVDALQKGLDGVQILAEPVMKVSSLVAKAWFVL